MYSQANIRNTFFDQKFPQPPEVGVSQRHRQTDRHTEKQTDMAIKLEIHAAAVATVAVTESD